MHVRRDILFLAALGIFLTGCDIDELASFGNAHAYEKDFHQHYPLKAGGTLSLDSFNGSVEISGWDQDRVQVDGVQYGSTERLRDSISIDVVANGNTVQIRTYGTTATRYCPSRGRRLGVEHKVYSTQSGTILMLSRPISGPKPSALH